jgi:polygalacturonase/pectin methylesterase-like acyl-CoA thioesterase
MGRKVTRKEFLRTAGRLAAAVASSGALATVGEAAATGDVRASEDDGEESRSPFSPRPGARHVCADTPLTITFDQPPAIGTAGLIRVVRSDGTVVDTIDLAAATQTRTIGLNPTPFNYHPVLVGGDQASIHLHRQLAYGETYSVLIDAGAFTTASGQALPGVTDPAVWRFSTKPAPPSLARGHLTVAADGSGDFATVQGAVDLVPAGNTKRVRISVRNGTYTEIVYIGAAQPFIAVQGEDRGETVIQYANNNSVNPGSSRAMFGMDASDFTLSNITLHNTTPEGGSQAEALRGNGQRIVLDHVTLKSRQDTLMLQGSAYVTHSYIEGDVDFMWGHGTVFFNECELRALHRTVSTSGDYYTQIRNVQTQNGNVYHRCRLTPDPNGTPADVAFLARIDPTVFPFSQVVYIDCAMGPHVSAAGWLLNHATTAPFVQFWEYRSTDLQGRLLDVSGRAPFSRQLTVPEVSLWSDPEFVLGWAPPDCDGCGDSRDQAERLASAILRTVHEPSIPEREFRVTAFGAVADGVTDAAGAFRSAIAACAAAGGGTVLVPSGTYFVKGPIWITGGNHMRLHLQRNTTLRFSVASADNPLPAEYPLLDGTNGRPRLSSGQELMSLVFASGVTDLAITGEGETSVIDGQAFAGRFSWWSWSGKTRVGWQPGDPIESVNGHPKRPRCVQPFDCTNVLVKGIKIVNTPNFQLRLVQCRNVIVDRVMAMSGDGPNNDGIDPASCVNVLIRNCTIDAGDDCIAVQAETGPGGTLMPSLNVLIEDCDLFRGHGAVAFGSGATGGVANVVARHLRLHDPRLQFGLRIKLNRASGGAVQHVWFRDVGSVGLTDACVLVDLHYNNITTGPLTPVARHVRVDNFRVGTGATTADGLFLFGLDGDPVLDVAIANSSFASVTTPEVKTNVSGVTLTNVTANGQPLVS